jgi:hypothetical protein
MVCQGIGITEIILFMAVTLGVVVRYTELVDSIELVGWAAQQVSHVSLTSNFMVS